MSLIQREGFAVALEQAILWYASQQEHGATAAEGLAERFAIAVDRTITRIARRPDSGVVWPHRRGYRFRLVEKPFQRWLLFYRLPATGTVELVEIIRGERDLPRRVR